MTDLVIFDWSGTISDDRDPVWRCNNLMRLHHGISDLPFEEWFYGTGTTLQGYFREQGVPMSQGELLRLFLKYFDGVVEKGYHPEMYDDVPDVLETLQSKNVKMAVISRHPQKFVMREAQKFEIDNFFDIIIGTVSKKDTKMKQICKKLNVSPQNAISVGDTPGDIYEARAAGLVASAVTGLEDAYLPRGYGTYKQIAETEPDHHFINLTELIDVIEEIEQETLKSQESS